ncbi:MAG: hypothetical protein ACK56I_27535, partial [bacterium]
SSTCPARILVSSGTFGLRLGPIDRVEVVVEGFRALLMERHAPVVNIIRKELIECFAGSAMLTRLC